MACRRACRSLRSIRFSTLSSDSGESVRVEQRDGIHIGRLSRIADRARLIERRNGAHGDIAPRSILPKA